MSDGDIWITSRGNKINISELLETGKDFNTAIKEHYRTLKLPQYNIDKQRYRVLLDAIDSHEKNGKYKGKGISAIRTCYIDENNESHDLCYIFKQTANKVYVYDIMDGNIEEAYNFILKGWKV